MELHLKLKVRLRRGPERFLASMPVRALPVGGFMVVPLAASPHPHTHTHTVSAAAA